MSRPNAEINAYISRLSWPYNRNALHTSIMMIKWLKQKMYTKIIEKNWTAARTTTTTTTGIVTVEAVSHNRSMGPFNGNLNIVE